MKTENGLNEIFDIIPAPKDDLVTVEVEEEVAETTQCDIDTNADEDYEVARKNLVELIDQGKEALESAMAMAEGSEHPRAFEVVGNLMTQLADLNEQLLRLSEQRQKIVDMRKSKSAVPAINSKNTAVFIGTPKELNKMLRDAKEQNGTT